MPLDIADTHVEERDRYAAKHSNFADEMDIALIAAHVTPLDLASLDEPDPDEATDCQHCDGRGWFMATDDRRPWRETKQTCWECA